MIHTCAWMILVWCAWVVELMPFKLNPIQVSAGRDFTCAIDDHGVLCWGDWEHGTHNVPELRYPSQVSAGYMHACAVDDTGVVCWGSNT